MKFSFFVGIDISKNTIDACLRDPEGQFQVHAPFTNDKKGFKAMIHWLNGVENCELKRTLFCMEHCGIYSLPLCEFLASKTFPFTLQSPLQGSRSMGIKRGKSDGIDARYLARYAHLFQSEIELTVLPSKLLLKIRQLLSFRERLTKTKVLLSVPAKEAKAFSSSDMHRLVDQYSSQHVKQINASIHKIDQQLEQLIQTDDHLEHSFDLVTSVPGVGLQIAAHLLVVTNGFTRFDHWRQFSCYCSLAPFEHTSGTSIRGKTRITKLGNRKLKTLIGNGVASTIRWDQELRAYYDKKIQEGKHHMSVRNAIKNKIIGRVFAVVKRGAPYVKLQQHLAQA